MMGYIESGRTEGAALACGARRVGTRGYFFEPTVFAEVRDDRVIARNEVFGPVMSIIPFRGLNDVIHRANHSLYGIAAGVWSRDIRGAHAVANSVRPGTVSIEC